MSKKLYPKKSVYERRLYWYHVSTTLKNKYVNLVPWGQINGINWGGGEPNDKRICVAPSIEQCITAIPYILESTCNIYRTKSRLVATHPKGVFDSKITQEGWLHKPTSFVKIGIIKFTDVEKGLNIKHVIPEAASLTEPRRSGRVLKWWMKANIKRFIKKA